MTTPPDNHSSGGTPPREPQQPRPRHWRSSSFIHSDIEDIVDRAVSDADHYAPESRADFLRMAADQIREAADASATDTRQPARIEENTEIGAGRPPSNISPRRVWRRRIKGWKMPENTVSVCRPGRFGNPFIVGPGRTQRQAVDCFRHWLTTPGNTAGIPGKKQAILDGLQSLRGKNLACYCKPGTPCHADVLLDMANAKAMPPEGSESASGSPSSRT